MGKNLIQQKRGKGGPRYLAPSFNYAGEAKHKSYSKETVSGLITELIDCPGHSAPLMKIKYDDGEECLLLASEGLKIGDRVSAGSESALSSGNILPLKDLPEGTLVNNIESMPGDGGKFARSSGTFGRVLSKIGDSVSVMLPSKKEKLFVGECRAAIGVLAGGGRREKPFIKAGNKFHAMRAKNKLYPIVCGQSMNAVNHPHGGSRSSKKNNPLISPRFASPGRKAGALHPRRTGRRKR